ncbi:DUF6636 domain-containing protein [Frigidibacter oleivorans]|uniref:DUF6636 domain-containing protein n=1 Tax=Frigidibacter oleivorans TaxID=2487129 RepID=UPI000F8D2793|nr:DUF6636 domain-containing protein [Frigidibacter oleivorans]
MRRLALLVLAILPLAPSTARADVFLFRMPSGNVYCSVGIEAGSSDILCTIVDRSGPPARPAPADCMAFWGHVFFMRDTGPVEMECTDRHLDSRLAASVQDVAPYGVTGSFGGIVCLSLQTGLECRNASGHGFKLARGAQIVF